MFLYKLIKGNLPMIFSNIQKRMTYKMYGKIMFFLIKLFFKRKDNIHFIHISFDGFNPIFFPRPNLWRNIIVSFKSFFLGPLGNSKIKPRIIYKNNNIGVKFENVFFTMR